MKNHQKNQIYTAVLLFLYTSSASAQFTDNINMGGFTTDQTVSLEDFSSNNIKIYGSQEDISLNIVNGNSSDKNLELIGVSNTDKLNLNIGNDSGNYMRMGMLTSPYSGSDLSLNSLMLNIKNTIMDSVNYSSTNSETKNDILSFDNVIFETDSNPIYMNSNSENIDLSIKNSVIKGEGNSIELYIGEKEFGTHNLNINIENFKSLTSNNEDKSLDVNIFSLFPENNTITINVDNTNVSGDKNIINKIQINKYGSIRYDTYTGIPEDTLNLNNAKFNQLFSALGNKTNATITSDNNALFNNKENKTDAEWQQIIDDRQQSIFTVPYFSLELYDGNNSNYKLVNQGFKTYTDPSIKDANGFYKEFIPLSKISSYIALNGVFWIYKGDSMTDPNGDTYYPEVSGIGSTLELSGKTGDNSYISMGTIIGNDATRTNQYSNPTNYDPVTPYPYPITDDYINKLYKKGEVEIKITNNFNGELNDVIDVDHLTVENGNLTLAGKEYNFSNVNVEENGVLNLSNIYFKQMAHNGNWIEVPISDLPANPTLEDRFKMIGMNAWENNVKVAGKFNIFGTGLVNVNLQDSNIDLKTTGLIDTSLVTGSGSSAKLKFKSINSNNGTIKLGAYLDNSANESDHLTIKDLFGTTKIDLFNRATSYKLLEDGGIELIHVENPLADSLFGFSMDTLDSPNGKIQYTLEKRGDKWYVVSAGEEVADAPIAKKEIVIPGSDIYVENMKGTVNSTKSRIGDQRFEKDGSNFWMNGIYADYKLSPIQSRNNFVQLGLDREFNNNVIAGVFFDYGDINFKHPMVNGDAKAYGLGFYASKTFEEDFFVDGVFRTMRGSVKYDSYAGKHDVHGYSFDVTAGKRIIQNDYNITPFVSLSHNKVSGYTLSESEAIKWASPNTRFNEAKLGVEFELAKNDFKPKLSIAAVNTNGLKRENEKSSFVDAEVKLSINKEHKNWGLNASLNNRFGTMKETTARVGVSYKW